MVIDVRDGQHDLRLMHIEVPVVIHHYLDFFVVVFAVWISHFRVFCFLLHKRC